MSNEQPDALQLADAVFQWYAVFNKYNLSTRCFADAATELRRQHAEIERLRGCLLWLLWHHQGASSPTGQPIRRALGIDQHAPMTEAQIEAGQRFGAGAACATACGVKLEGDAE